MNLAYVTIFGTFDIHAWSGLGVYMLSTLQGAGFQTETIGNFNHQHGFLRG